MLRRLALRFTSFGVLWLLVSASACNNREYVRGDSAIDSEAMSTGLDKRDIQKLLSEGLNKLRVAPIMDEWRSKGGKETVAIFPFQNETSEHIDSQLSAALSETETWLIDANVVTVIDRSRQEQMIADIEGGRRGVFNPANVPKYGKQLGVKYYVTGKVQAADERTDDMRRVQYFLFLQVIEVETSAIRFQHKSYVTKAAR
ncbi:MAG: penicillin-binding protein activator LpoB [Polyangiaceae bacterium]